MISDERIKNVLTDLLRLYDWRKELGLLESQMSCEAHSKDAADQMKRDLRRYGREKKAAWDEARACLQESAAAGREEINPPDGGALLPNDELADALLEAVLEDVTNRSGWENEWDSWDDDIHAEIRRELKAVIQETLRRAPSNAEDARAVATVEVGEHDHGPFMFKETPFGTDTLSNGAHNLYTRPAASEGEGFVRVPKKENDNE